MNILILSDNKFLIEKFAQLVLKKNLSSDFLFDFACSPVNQSLLNDSSLTVKLNCIAVKNDSEQLIEKYDLIFSLHCKQLFPAELVKKVRCVNVHPGYNPYNRGWFPQVFSILNQLPFGATIHEIDEQLDHGAIIAQKKVVGEIWETSLDIYNKILQAEIELLEEYLPAILNNSYQTIAPKEEGNLNLKKDFNALCKLDLNETLTMGEAIDRLRALTHGEYKNAWFAHPETGEKIYVSINLEKKKMKE